MADKLNRPPRGTVYGAPITPPGAAGGQSGGGVVVQTLDRNVKYYKLTSSEVDLLGALGVFASLVFGVATACLGVYFDIGKDIAFAGDTLPEQAMIYKDLVRPLTGWISLGFFVASLITAGIGVRKFHSIKSEHTERTSNEKI